MSLSLIAYVQLSEIIEKFYVKNVRNLQKIPIRNVLLDPPRHSFTELPIKKNLIFPQDASMKFFFRVRNNVASPEELPEVPLCRSPSISDRKSIQTDANKTAETESKATNIVPATTDTLDCFVKPKSPKPIVPEIKCEKQNVCDPIDDSTKTDLVKRGTDVRKSVNNEKSDKLEKLETKRNSELRKSLSNNGSDKAEKKGVKEDEKNQKVKNVKKCKDDTSEKRVENIKLKIDLSRQNSVTIIKSSVNDLKMKFKTERDNKNESSETSNKSKDEVNGKKKQEIDVIKLAKVTEKSDANDSEVKYEIKSPKNNQCDNKSPVIKCESEIKTESDIDEKKSEFLESFDLTPTKSLSPEKLAILADRKKIDNATANDILSKKEMFAKNSTKSVPWHQPYEPSAKLNSKASSEIKLSAQNGSSLKNLSGKSSKEHLFLKQRTTPAPSSSRRKSPVMILPKLPLLKIAPSQQLNKSECSSTVTLHSNKPNKDNPLKTTITKSASLSPELLIIDENRTKSESPQVTTKKNGAEPTVSKRKSKEPIKNIPKRRYSLSLEQPMKFKLPLEPHLADPNILLDLKSKLPLEPPINLAKLPMVQSKTSKLFVAPSKSAIAEKESKRKLKLPSMPSIIDDVQTVPTKKDAEIKPASPANRIWCVDPCALGGKSTDKAPSIQETKSNENETTNANAQKKEFQSTVGKMLPPVSTTTPRKPIDSENKGKIKINRLKAMALGPRKLPTILPKPSPSSPATSLPQITKMLKNPDTEIKQIANGKDIKVYGPAMEMATVPLGSTSPAYVPQFNNMHRNPSVGYLNYALMNSRSRSNDLPLGMRSPAYSPPSPIYSPNSPQYSPNYNIPSQPQFKYMKSPAHIPNYAQVSNGSNGQSANSSQKSMVSSPKKTEKVNENNKRPHSSTPDGNSPPEKQAKVQSLLESCKINFPSSLSITLHEQNDSSLNNPLFNPKRNSPVNNYIEIVKLPEIPAKEEVKQVTQPKIEQTKTPNVKPLLPKPSTPKSTSPKPQVSPPNDKEKMAADTTNAAKTTPEPKKSPEIKSVPELNAMDKNVAALLKVRRESQTGYQGKFLESILDKNPKPNPVTNGSFRSKNAAPFPLISKVTIAPTKPLLKTSDTPKSTKPVSPKYSPPKQSKSDAALDLSAHVGLVNKATNNNNNKSQLDQPDMTALFADAMARASHNPSFMLPSFGAQMGINMQQALWLEHLGRMRRAGHDKLNEALESFVKNLNSKNTESSS